VKFWVVFVLFAWSFCLVQAVRPPLVASLFAPRPLGEVLVLAKIFW
jgi:hypothetical protein